MNLTDATEKPIIEEAVEEVTDTVESEDIIEDDTDDSDDDDDVDDDDDSSLEDLPE